MTIDSLAFGGAGVARLDGYVVFVSGAVPGDRVRLEICLGRRKTPLTRAQASAYVGDQKVAEAELILGVVLDTSDIDADYAELKAKGVDVDDEISRMGDPVPPMFWLRDPEQNTLLIVQPSN